MKIMNSSEYAQKLYRFNFTEKYTSELEFMSGLLRPSLSEVIVDYGCGLGTAVHYFNKEHGCDVFGYDVNDYWEGDRSRSIKKVTEGCDKVFFMHSLAHIVDAENVISSLKELGVKEVHVITPNGIWLSIQGNKNYTADDTVIEHYTAHTLERLFDGCKIIQQGQFGKRDAGMHERLFISVEL